MKRAISNLRLNLLGPRRKTDSIDGGDRSDDDDHLSGQTTPHPSGLDKRLPQILHGFQQVCGALVTPILARKSSCTPSLLERSLPHTKVEAGVGGDFPYSPASTSTSSSTATSRSASTTRHVSPSCFSAAAKEKGEALRLTASAFLEGKDTPPATPRGTTSAGSALNGTSAITSNPAPPRPVPGNITPVSGSTSSGTKDATHAAPTVGPPKGKMVVRILEARNLRPSKEPYVVCTFESNEFISKGPKKEEMGAGESPEKNGALAGIAIPMKSRQSSSTSLSELQGGGAKKAGTPNPKWEHEAVLYVLLLIATRHCFFFLFVFMFCVCVFAIFFFFFNYIAAPDFPAYSPRCTCGFCFIAQWPPPPL